MDGTQAPEAPDATEAPALRGRPAKRRRAPAAAHLRPAKPAAFAERDRPRPLLIAAPCYRRPDLARRVVGSLIACAADVCAVQGEVVVFDDSPADPTLAEALDELTPLAQAAFPFRVVRNARNLGFVRTCNQAMEEAVRRGMDVLLLNSDTVVTEGALPEMVRVSRTDPMIGFVNPRSNNATLATLPFQDRFRHMPPAQAREAWSALAPRLPTVSYAPTTNGFCMLARWPVLAEFGGFDEVYAAGYNEENDLAMRAGRRGWRAALANHAFVWHEGEGSFGIDQRRAALEARNRTTLLARYPEYDALVRGYFMSAEQRAEILLGALIPDPQGKVDVAFDFSSFVAAHNGTFAAGAQLLAAAAKLWTDRYNLFVLCGEDTYQFHGYGRFGVPRREPHGPEAYAAIFRVGQPYDWDSVQRLVLKGATFGVFMLDTISVDCANLADEHVRGIWSFTCGHAEFVAATSRLTFDQLGRRFDFGPQVERVKSLHSLDLADYALPPPDRGFDAPAPGYLFVIGNHYWHKDVTAAVNALAHDDPAREVVVLGGEDEREPVDAGRHAPPVARPLPNVRRLAAGKLTDAQMSALYAGAAAVVVPSHYEGFGFPVLNALAARRPVYVRALPVFEELWETLGGEANLHAFQTTGEMVAMLAHPAAWDADGASPGRPGDALRAARDIGAAIDRAITRADYRRIVRRIGAARTDEVRAPEPVSPPDYMAREVARVTQRWVRAWLDVPGAQRAARAVGRLVRAARRR